MSAALFMIAAPAEVGTLDELVFAAGWLWWLFFLVPLAIGAFVWAARQRRRAMAALGNPSLIARLVGSVHQGNRLWVTASVIIGVTLVIGALLRPQYGGEAKIVPASGLDVVLVVDYSKSMLAKDVYPTRIERLEAELKRFLEDADRRGDRVGVVVFAGRPRGFPITRDSRMLELYLERADPRTENPGGTAIGKALQLALQFLVDARRPPEDEEEPAEIKPPPEAPEIPPAESDQAIILLTDGEDTVSRPLEVAAEAARLGVRIYTVGIGSKSGEPIPRFDEEGNPDGFVTDEQGNYLMTRLDEGLLQEIAKATGGRYIKVDTKHFGLDEVRTMLEDLSRSQQKDTIDIHREEGFVFLALPALLFLTLALGLSDRRRVSA